MMRDDFYYRDKDVGYSYDHYFEEIVAYLCSIDDKLEKLTDRIALENAVKRKRKNGKVGSP